VPLADFAVVLDLEGEDGSALFDGVLSVGGVGGEG
jgi:hypothetical protein